MVENFRAVGGLVHGVLNSCRGKVVVVVVVVWRNEFARFLERWKCFYLPQGPTEGNYVSWHRPNADCDRGSSGEQVGLLKRALSWTKSHSGISRMSP